MKIQFFLNLPCRQFMQVASCNCNSFIYLRPEVGNREWVEVENGKSTLPLYLREKSNI